MKQQVLQKAIDDLLDELTVINNDLKFGNKILADVQSVYGYNAIAARIDIAISRAKRSIK
mgnify:CR=1 FL=1